MTDMDESGNGMLAACAGFEDREVDDLLALEMAMRKSVRQGTLANMGEEAAIYVIARLGLQPFAEIYFFLNVPDTENRYHSNGICAMLQTFEQAQQARLPDPASRILCANALFSPVAEGVRPVQFELAQRLAKAWGMDGENKEKPNTGHVRH